MNKQLTNEYACWFKEQSWDYFFTGTFRGDYTPNGARRAADRFFKRYSGQDTIVVFIKRGKLNGKICIHALLRFKPKKKPPDYFIYKRWFETYGRAQVQVPESQEAVSIFCAQCLNEELADEPYFVQ